MKYALVVIAVFACQSSKREPSMDCESVVPGAIDRMMATNKKDLPPEAFARAQEVAPRLKAAITRVCREDKWSLEVLECHALATTEADIDLCQFKLPEAQRMHTNKATQAVIEQFNESHADKPAQGSAHQGSAIK